jgi:hypothetical protein
MVTFLPVPPYVNGSPTTFVTKPAVKKHTNAAKAKITLFEQKQFITPGD